MTAGTRALRAGAGRSPIDLPDDLFPIEGFVGSHDPVHARALLLDADGERDLLVALELPSVRDDAVDRLRGLAAASAGTAARRVWLGVTHTLAAPHLRSEAARTDPDVAHRDTRLRAAVESAVERAVAEAVATLVPCRVGAGTAEVALNVNRDLRTPDGWVHAPAPDRFSDRTLTVLRVDALDGSPVAVVFGYDLRSSVTEHVGRGDGRDRLVGADCTGAAARSVERHAGGVALFVPGAMADQMPVPVPGTGPDPYAQAAAVGERLADHVRDVYRDLVVHAPGATVRRAANVDLPTADGGRVELPLHLLVVGPVALLGLRPEVASPVGARIRAASPWPCTVVGTLVDGGAKYLVDDEARAAGTRTALASPFGAGASDRLVAAALTLLEDAHDHQEPR